ncbi:unnamed protein product [Notodromas monacha]|uniref:Uncharacterized protein n=1 Tax=Notodromas monacha TaxID=399045 RepID=A0A7R9BH71_9CRUS|nr:unnamed protein product [Notodromas monacha]CAG0914730.1 unnamed protein product [Notodromas monacha]
MKAVFPGVGSTVAAALDLSEGVLVLSHYNYADCCVDDIVSTNATMENRESLGVLPPPNDFQDVSNASQPRKRKSYRRKTSSNSLRRSLKNIDIDLTAMIVPAHEGEDDRIEQEIRRDLPDIIRKHLPAEMKGSAEEIATKLSSQGLCCGLHQLYLADVDDPNEAMEDFLQSWKNVDSVKREVKEWNDLVSLTNRAALEKTGLNGILGSKITCIDRAAKASIEKAVQERVDDSNLIQGLRENMKLRLEIFRSTAVSSARIAAVKQKAMHSERLLQCSL